MPQEIERRAGVPVEIRADGDGIRVSGYAAVFNEQASIGGHFREVVAPGAFRESLSRDDVPFLIMHAGLPLARTKSGTLTLTEDSKGLRMEAMLDPEDPDVQRIVPKMKRGDLSKMSFGFRAVKQTWDDAQDPPLRTLQEVELYDVSVVSAPAYDGTDIGLRSLEAARQERSEHNKLAARQRIAQRRAAAEHKFRRIASV